MIEPGDINPRNGSQSHYRNTFIIFTVRPMEKDNQDDY
jgi:hypothetical protein